MDMRQMTDRQEQFAQLIGTHGKIQSDAYRMTHRCDHLKEATIHNAAFKLANRTDIMARIDTLRREKARIANTAVNFNTQKLLETYFQIAFVDPNELTSLRVGACRHCHGEGHKYQWKEDEYLDALVKYEELEAKRKPSDPPAKIPDPAGGFGFKRTRDPHPECPKCEGEGETRVVWKDTTQLSPGARLLYQGIQQTKDGIKLLFADKNKALDQLGRMLGAYDDRLKVDLHAEAKVLQLTTTDPLEAARAYQAMITGT